MSIGYYLWASYRRKALDRFQEQCRDLYKGVVLDIGGRDRGAFVKPRHSVERWIFADINEAHHPDMVLDVADMKAALADESIDVVNALELFEHVARIEEGLRECVRVLKPGGLLLLSVPFLYPVHGDPYDFQRWTREKWIQEIDALGLHLDSIRVTGRFFAVLGDMIKTGVHAMPWLPRRFFQLFYPILDLLVRLDRTGWVHNHKKLAGYHGGYAMVARKPDDSQ